MTPAEPVHNLLRSCITGVMGIDDQRQAIRDAAARRQRALAEKQVVFDGIMDRIATDLRQSIAHSSGSHTYSLKRHKRPAHLEAAAGVTIHRRGQKFPLWSYWISSSDELSNSVSMGPYPENVHGRAEEINRDWLVKKGMDDAEMKLARDLETNGAVGCAASVIALVGFATVFTPFV